MENSRENILLTFLITMITLAIFVFLPWVSLDGADAIYANMDDAQAEENAISLSGWKLLRENNPIYPIDMNALYLIAGGLVLTAVLLLAAAAMPRLDILMSHLRFILIGAALVGIVLSGYDLMMKDHDGVGAFVATFRSEETDDVLLSVVAPDAEDSYVARATVEPDWQFTPSELFNPNYGYFLVALGILVILFRSTIPTPANLRRDLADWRLTGGQPSSAV